jgi:hypothetical protein
MAPQSTHITCTGPAWLPCACIVFAGVAIMAVLLLGTDEAARLLDFYPPWRQPASSSRMNSLLLSARLAIILVGSYVAAKLDRGRAA